MLAGDCLMLGLTKKAPGPEEVIGPDGMTDFARELRRQRDRAEVVVAKIDEAVARMTGIDAGLVHQLPRDYITLAVLVFLSSGQRVAE